MVGGRIAKFCIAAIALISWFHPSSTLANNGSVVTTSVVKGITVDGAFADWPADVPWYSMDLNLYGDPENDENDFTADFRVGVDPVDLKVYVAIRVRDESPVPRPKGNRSWTSNDSAHVYLGAPSLSEDSKSSRINRFPIQFDESLRYDEKSKTWTCENSFDLRLAGFENLESPFSAAFSIGFHDKDADGSFSAKFWSPRIAKHLHPGRRGDLVVCGRSRGRLRGIVRRGSGGDDIGRIQLHFEAVDNPLLQVDLLSDADGSYELELPPGEYRRTGCHLKPEVLHVRADQTTDDLINYPTLPLRKLRLADFDSPAKARPGFSPTLRRSPDPYEYGMNKLNGLPDSRIFALEQDSAGALWIGTLANLATFDGENLRVYDREFARETHGLWRDDRFDRLWIASRYEVGYIANGELSKFPLLDERRATCVGPTHDGRVCVGTRAGLFLWDEQRFEYHSRSDGLPDELVTSLASDERRGVTWIGTNMGLAAFDGNDYKVFDHRDGLDDPRIVSLFVDSQGRLWVGTASSLYYFDEEFVLVRKHPTEKERYARSFVELETGEIKIGAFNESLTIPVAFPEVPPKVEAEVRPSDAMLLDRDMQFWRGSEDGELRRIDRGLRRPYRIPNGKCQFLHSIGDDLWFIQFVEPSGEAAIWEAVRLNKKTMAATKFPLSGLASDAIEVSTFHASSSGIWVGTVAHGVFQLIDGEWQHLELPTETFSEVAAITEDSQNRIWIATLRKLFRIEGGEITHLKVPRRPYSADLLHVVEAPDGQFAIGTTDGIVVVDDKMHPTARYNESNGLISNVPRAIAFGDDGTMWVATFHGLQSVKDGEFREFRSSDGMLDDKPSWFVRTWGDEVWCGSVAGINRVLPGHNVVQHLLGNECLANCIIRSVVPDGEFMWLGGDAGIWKYRRGEFAPRLFIDEVVTSESLGARDSLSVTTDLKTIAVKFHANSLKSRCAGIVFQYQLEGVDESWNSIRKNELVLDVPKAGSYQLKLRAIDRDLLVSSPGTVAIRVRPPYGKWASRVAFVVASVASVILGLLYFARVRQEKSALEKSVRKKSAQLSDLERQLQHAQKMKALGTLASGVAHDFNNSLMAISGNAELALLTDSVAEKDQLITEVLSVTEQVAGLTESMLMFGGRSSSSKSSVDIRVAIGDAEKMLRRVLPASIEFRCDVPDEPVFCEADLSQIQQAVLNLSLNARDAMSNGGLLIVKLKRDGETACLTVQDNGHGMSEETRERIFEPFYSEKPRGKGTGLGLSVVHAIVSDHDGEMNVSSSVGNGTIFSLTFSTTKSGTTTSKRHAAVAGSYGRVLLADDEVQIRGTLAKGLVRAGFDVETVGDGTELMKQFARSSYDLVILDVDMPGKNGWDCLTELRKVEADLDAIVISGLPNQERRFDQRTQFIQKPFSLRVLTEKVTTMIHRGESGTDGFTPV